MPLTPAELAADAVAVKRAGAFAVHLHPRDAKGEQTLKAAACDGTVAAIRVAAPGLPIGLSSSAAIDPDPFARAAAIGHWRQRPDFLSVNVSELGWEGLVRAALHAGIAVEVGLATPGDAEEFFSSRFSHRILRALVEVEGGAAEAHAISRLIPDGIPQLWHGYEARTWEVIEAGNAAGHDIRIGLEDVLVLPGGEPAPDNAALVTVAVAMTGAA